jgi:hypothetical protein
LPRAGGAPTRAVRRAAGCAGAHRARPGAVRCAHRWAAAGAGPRSVRTARVAAAQRYDRERQSPQSRLAPVRTPKPRNPGGRIPRVQLDEPLQSLATVSQYCTLLDELSR